MSKIHDEIAMCAQLEQHRYILSEFVKNKGQLYKALENNNPKPQPPQQPGDVKLTPYPKYDEKKYYAKNKTEKLPTQPIVYAASTCLIVALACCGGVITIVFAPFVLAISVILFLLYAILTPIAKRRTARKAYIQECEQIDYWNRCAQSEVEQYQKDYAEYERNLQLYETRLQNVSMQKRMFEDSMENVKNTLDTISTILGIHYAKSIPYVYGKYNNYIAIITINSYLQSGQCSTLESAIEKFNTQKQLGRISPTIEYALSNRSVTKESMGAVIASYDDAQKTYGKLHKETVEYFAYILEQGVNPSQLASIDIYCNNIKEQLRSV